MSKTGADVMITWHVIPEPDTVSQYQFSTSSMSNEQHLGHHRSLHDYLHKNSFKVQALLLTAAGSTQGDKYLRKQARNEFHLRRALDPRA